MTAPAAVSPLEQLRLDRGKTRAQVAADLDLSERHLLRLERGVTRLKRANALMFADYYGVPLEAVESGAVAA